LKIVNKTLQYNVVRTNRLKVSYLSEKDNQCSFFGDHKKKRKIVMVVVCLHFLPVQPPGHCVKKYPYNSISNTTKLHGIELIVNWVKP
jgi:hypothetical protein